MCSWCWAFAPGWSALRESLSGESPDRLVLRKLLGGLAPDSDAPMPQPMQEYLQQTWSAIQRQVPGTRFNFDFWQRCEPRRSTWPACRAVIAARRQGSRYDDEMTAAIQRAYYLDARNPSDRDTLVALAGELGLDVRRFGDALDSADVHAEHQREMELVRNLGVRGFPALVLVGDGWGREIAVDYTDPAEMQRQVLALLSENEQGSGSGGTPGP
jgi:putative protein-disulfide isomerase